MADDREPTADGGETAAAGRRADPGEALLERFTDGVVTVDADLTVTGANDAARDLLGAPDGGLVGERVRDAFPGGVQPGERFERALTTGEATTVEAFDPGQDRWLEARAYPSEAELSVVLRDVTERRRASEELRDSERSLQRFHDLASDPDLPRSEKVERMLAVGCERLGLELGFLTRFEDNTGTVVEMVGDHPDIRVGTSASLPESYCRRLFGSDDPVVVTDASAAPEGDPAHEQFGLETCVGASVSVDEEPYGTVCFAGLEPREREFSASELTFVDLLAEWVGYIIEQRRYETQLRGERRRLETIIENVPVVVFALDPDGVFTLSRGHGLEGLEIEPGEAVGESIFDRYSGYPAVCAHARRALNGQETHHTVEMNSGHTLEAWYQPVIEGGEVVQVVGVARNITELVKRREQLSGLLETARSLMQARSRGEVAELAAAASRDVLGFSVNVVRLYDADTRILEPAAQAVATDSDLGDRPTYDVGEGLPGTAFATGESRVVDDLRAVETDAHTDAFRSALYYPMGVHGTISVGAVEPAAFDETDERVLGLLATAAAAACARARRERQIRETREHLETVVERINGLIENTVEVLVGATTREELEAGVVAELAAAEPYTLAWIGRLDVTSEALSPAEWAGDAAVPVEDATFDLGGSNPVAAALADGTPRVVTRDEGGGALGCTGDGPETAIVLPLAYKDTTYGAVVAFADQPDAFDERERAVLSALSRAVANAINAVERGRILEADRVIELELAVGDGDLLFSRLSREPGCTVEAADFDYRQDGRLRLYLTADCADGGQLAERAAGVETVAETNLIADNDAGNLLELVVEGSLVGLLAEFGAAVREVIGKDGETRITVELPFEAEARELFELVSERHPGTDLVGYHEHERPVETRQEFRAALADRFTERQKTALRTAYFGGFFDWPRGVDGNDLADAMDVSRPTYHQHLRAAQRKVFEELFE
jgi:GAF domain-containing protein